MLKTPRSNGEPAGNAAIGAKPCAPSAPTKSGGPTPHRGGDAAPVASSDPAPTVRFGSPDASGTSPSSLDVAFPSAFESATDGKPRMFGNYQLLGELGRGGMGVIYKARHLALDRVVALKVNRSSDSDTADGAVRFGVEAAAVAKLDHPAIVPVYDVGSVHGQQYYSMAFVEGQSLAAAVAVGPLASRRAVEIVQAIAEAVAYAHGQGVIHRDIKPENVLLDASDRPRITDFGIAKCQGNDAHLTVAGQAIGTPSYMPPEQAQGRMSEVGPLADVYSLGATLYCLLTGRPPFAAATALDTFKLVIESEPVSPRLLNSELDRDLETIVLRCLEKRPEKRYASAQELSDDLGRWLQNKPIVARPVGGMQKAVRWCRRNPLPAALSASMVAIVAAAFCIVTYSYVGARQARDQAIRHERIGRKERYVANMMSVSSALQSANVAIAFRSHESSPPEDRGWEWNYFKQQLDRSECVVQPMLGNVENFQFVNNREFVIDADALTVRSTKDGQIVRTFDDRRPGLRSAVSGDCLAIAYATKAGPIVIRGLKDAARRTVLEKSPQQPYELRLNSDGSRCVAADAATGALFVWDGTSGRLLQVAIPKGKTADEALCALDERHVAYHNSKSLTTRLWDVKSGACKATLKGLKVSQQCCVLTPDGKSLIASDGYPSNLLRMWDTATGELVAELRGPKNECRTIQISNDGERIAATSYDQSIYVWDRDGKPISTLVGHTGWVMGAAFSPNGKRIVSCSQDRTVRLWETDTGAQLAVLFGHRQIVYHCSFSPDGSLFASHEGHNALRIWNTQRAECNGVCRGHSGFVYGVAFHPDGRRVSSCAWDGTVRIWDATTSQQLAVFPHRENASINCVAFSPDGKWLAALDRDDSVVLWEVATGQPVCRWKLATNVWVNTRLAFSPDGRRIAAGNYKSEVHLFDVASRKEIAVFRNNIGGVQDVCFGVDGSWLAVAGFDADCGICIWDPKEEKLVRQLSRGSASTYALSVTRDGKFLLAGLSDGTIRVLSVADWSEKAAFRLGVSIYSIAATPDGSRLFVGTSDNGIRVWDLSSGLEVAELRGHGSYVHALSLSADGTQLASASGDRTIRIWDTLSVSARSALGDQQQLGAAASGGSATAQPKKDTDTLSRHGVAAAPHRQLQEWPR